MGIPRRAVGRAEDRGVGAPFFRANVNKFLQNGGGMIGEEDASSLAGL